ncbi:hypothetical protein KSS87_003225 [Heliosperma pusillum]|nr:hypothetical protein KSS87_003225 [Heliosperma pusillum]
MEPKIITGDAGYVLDDVPHFDDYLPNLPAVQHKDGPRGTHFRRQGPRQKVYFEPDEVTACIVTCGGLCPGLNTVIREIVCGLDYMYGAKRILGIEGGYKGFYSKNTITLTPKSVDNIHKRGGTILGTSRGGYVTSKIVDSIQDRGINQEVRKRGLKCSVVGIPKTVDNDIPVIDKSFGFDTAVEEAQRAINAAHVEAESVENGIGLVKLMGRDSGYIAMQSTLASRDVDCCLIPESPFYLEGPGGLFEFIERRLRSNGHMVIVIAEGAGEKLEERDASGNKIFKDVGLWMSHMIREHFARPDKINVTLKYIDPTYMIRAVPANASDNVYCTILAQSAVHGAMAGYTGFTVGPVNGRECYIPFYRITGQQHKVVITDRMWARLLSSTNQPCFMDPKNAVIPLKQDAMSLPVSSSDQQKENDETKSIPQAITKQGEKPVSILQNGVGLQNSLSNGFSKHC